MSNVTQPGPRRMLRPALPNVPDVTRVNAAGLNHCSTVSAPFGIAGQVRQPGGAGADVVVALRDGERPAGPRAVDAAHQPAAEHLRADAVLQHGLPSPNGSSAMKLPTTR